MLRHQRPRSGVIAPRRIRATIEPTERRRVSDGPRPPFSEPAERPRVLRANLTTAMLPRARGGGPNLRRSPCWSDPAERKESPTVCTSQPKSPASGRRKPDRLRKTGAQVQSHCTLGVLCPLGGSNPGLKNSWPTPSSGANTCGSSSECSMRRSSPTTPSSPAGACGGVPGLTAVAASDRPGRDGPGHAAVRLRARGGRAGSLRA